MQMSLGANHCLLACMLLSSNQQLPFCVLSIYEAGSIYKEEEERLQPRMQSLRADKCVCPVGYMLVPDCQTSGSSQATYLQPLLATCQVCFPDCDTSLHPR